MKAIDIRVAAGGKGANPAVAAARLGARVQLVGAVGDDEAADAVLAQLAADGIDVGGVERLPDVRTGQIVHLVEPGGNRRYVEWVGANGRLTDPGPRMRERCAPGVTALISTALPLESVTSGASAARRAGATVVADLAGESDTNRSVLPLAHTVRGDAGEIASLTGHPVDDFDSAAHAARWLQAQGPETVVVQAGGDGDVVLAGARELRLPRLPVEVVDPTGAGDALITTFAVRLAQGAELEQAAREASAAAARLAGRLGGRPAG